MFVFTLHGNTLRRAGTILVCGVCLAVTIAQVSRLANKSVAANVGVAVTISGTQDIAAYFSQNGVELDMTTADVDSVKIPKRWDDSFLAFNTLVSESGMSLEGYKGKTVEKWTALCPGMSGGEARTYGVMLVYKNQAIGAYLLTQPDGQVSGLTAARETMADALEAAQGELGWPTE